jgi:hypothetical protein
MGGAGSDLALDTADAVVMRDDLATIPAVITLSRRARRVVIANLAIAAAIITGLIIWDLAGHLPLPLGVAGHEGSPSLSGSTDCGCCAAPHGAKPWPPGERVMPVASTATRYRAPATCRRRRYRRALRCC